MEAGEPHLPDISLLASVAVNSAAVKGRAINLIYQSLTVTSDGHQQSSRRVRLAAGSQLHATERLLIEFCRYKQRRTMFAASRKQQRTTVKTIQF